VVVRASEVLIRKEKFEMGNAVERRMRVWRNGFDKVPIVGISPPTDEKEVGNKRMEENKNRKRGGNDTRREKKTKVATFPNRGIEA